MYQQLFILFALIFTGYALAKAGILNEAVTLGINKMILFFAFPCLIAYKLGTMEVSVQMAKDFVIVNVLGAVSFVLFTIIAHLYYRVRGLTDKVSAPMMLCSCMPNNGFLGYPVTLVFLGNPGLILMIAHGAIVFNVYTYSYAITYLRNSALKDKPKLTKGRVLTMVLQVALNPNIIGIEVGLIIFAAGISLDNVAGDYLSMIADMASPLAMIYTGAMLAKNKFLDMFKNKIVWEGVFLKLILIPAIFFALTYWLPISDLAKAILVLGVAFPSAATPVMLGQQNGLDTRQATQLLFMSTLLSMITLPVLMHILSSCLAL